jgi:hypothetical protein
MFPYIPEYFPHKFGRDPGFMYSLTWQAITLHLQQGGIPFLMTDALQGHTCWAGYCLMTIQGNWPNKLSQQVGKRFPSLSIHVFMSAEFPQMTSGRKDQREA